jgi:hypothetical protein
MQFLLDLYLFLNDKRGIGMKQVWSFEAVVTRVEDLQKLCFDNAPNSFQSNLSDEPILVVVWVVNFRLFLII